MKQDTAILIFSRKVKTESCLKKLHKNSVINNSLHTALFNKTVAVAKSSGLPFFIVDERLQNGVNFGEKFLNAIELIFSLGFKKVIAIGSDAALLNTGILLSASEAMNAGKNVLGQDSHGGIYMLGIQKNAYDQSLSYKIQWQTNQVFSELLTYFDSTSNSTFILPQLEDLNTEHEISELLFTGKKCEFLSLLRTICTSRNQGAGFLKLLYFPKNSIPSFSLRGPPVFEYFSRAQNEYSNLNTSTWPPFLKKISLLLLSHYLAYPA